VTRHRFNKRRARAGYRAVDGIVVLDKPAGMTSNGALQRVKHLFRAHKAGHTGSLDPLATGVLPLCLGEATKVSQFLLDSDKTYRVTVKLGETTNTGDAEGEVLESCADIPASMELVRDTLQQFLGVIDQVPPMYSALKQNGVPLYKLARQGKQVERASRKVEIYSLDLLNFEGNELEIEVDCSKGTYIRTLAEDLGNKLGCGGHVIALRRTRSAKFSESDCVTLGELEQLQQSCSKDDYSLLDRLLVPMDRAIEFLPAVDLPDVSAGWVSQGQPVLARHLPEEGLVRLYNAGRFIGIGSILDDGRVAPRRMIVDQV